MDNALIPFRFQGVSLREACWIEGKPYFTGRAIGEWLEAKHPDRYVHKLVERNTHILQFATFVKLTSVEGNREVSRDIQVYDPIGLQLIVMESRQPKAIQYKIAAAHLVYAYMRGELIPAVCISKLGDVFKIPCGRGRHRAVLEIAEEQKRHPATIYRWLKALKEGKKPTKTSWVRKENREKFKEFQRLKDSMKGVELSRMLGVPPCTISRWRRKHGYKHIEN